MDDHNVTQLPVTLRALQLSRLPVTVLSLFWRQRKAKFLTAASLTGIAFILWKIGSYRAKRNNTTTQGRVKNSLEIDRLFFRRLRALVRICFPKINSWEFVHLIVLAILLLSRTILTIAFANTVGSTAKALVEGEFVALLSGVTKVGVIAIPAAIVNSLLKYITSMLALYCRQRLTRFGHENYLSGITFYRTSSPGNQFYLSNCDQRITQDIEKFSVSLSNIFSSVFKPIVDVIVFTKTLSSSVGMKGPLLMFGYYFGTWIFLRSVMPSFAKLYAQQQQYENEFRFGHSRLIAHSEEVAFYAGHEREKEIIADQFQRIYHHSQTIFRLQTLVNVIDGWLIKYGATMVGYAIVAIPVFYAASKNKNATLIPAKKIFSTRAGDFTRNTQLLVALASSIGQLVLIYKKLLSLASYTTKVSQLFEQLENEKNANLENRIQKFIPYETMKQLSKEFCPPECIRGNNISLEHVPIISPDGRILIQNLSFEVKAGSNFLIHGPNGCGKTSIFRVLSGIWPLHCGKIVKPSNREIFYIPQHPYCPIGTLRDQLIYPYSHKQMLDEGHTDDDLHSLLELVNLSYIVKRPDSLDATGDWETLISRSERQRVAMVRVFFHKPRFAIFDMSTNAINPEVESFIYEHCKSIGITIITVSPKLTLESFHDHVLCIGEGGTWELDGQQVHAPTDDGSEDSEDEEE